MCLKYLWIEKPCISTEKNSVDARIVRRCKIILFRLVKIIQQPKLTCNATVSFRTKSLFTNAKTKEITLSLCAGFISWAPWPFLHRSFWRLCNVLGRLNHVLVTPIHRVHSYVGGLHCMGIDFSNQHLQIISTKRPSLSRQCLVLALGVHRIDVSPGVVIVWPELHRAPAFYSPAGIWPLQAQPKIIQQPLKS